MKPVIRRIIFKLVNNRVFNFKMYYFKILGMNIASKVNFKNTMNNTSPINYKICNEKYLSFNYSNYGDHQIYKFFDLFNN